MLLVSSLILSSCGEDLVHPYGLELRDDEEFAYGCHYYIPEGFYKLKVSDSEFMYSDGVAECYVDPLNPEQLTELGVDTEITVYAYSRQFAGLNGIPFDMIQYDEETDTAYVEYISDFGASTEGLAPEYFKWKIMRNKYYIYIATVNCPTDQVDKYRDLFDEWLKYTWAEAIVDAPQISDTNINVEGGNVVVQ